MSALPFREEFRRFRFVDATFDPASGEAALEYAFDDRWRFVERIDFGLPPLPLDARRLDAVERLVGALHLAAGISYFKAFVPPEMRIETGSISKAAAGFWRQVYLRGLGEFAHRNGLDLRDRLEFPSGGPPLGPLGVDLPHRSLVPVGGGKDSLVTVELLRQEDPPPTLFAVNPKGPILATVKASGLEHLFVRRTLDPVLFELNAKGALNGHVPITAIISLIALTAAAIHGFDRVVMSNERSANVGSFVADGLEVNHQWSKSLVFERMLRGHLQASLVRGIDWFSLLRPLSELAIARLFARSKRYDRVFSSCNRNFHLQGDGPERRWCRDCPKCRFVFLALAPFMERERLIAIFGGDMADDPGQIEGFSELCGISGHKPFECVGETEEAAAALFRLGGRPEWRDRAVLAALLPGLRYRAEELDLAFREALGPDGGHCLPDRYWNLLHDALA